MSFITGRALHFVFKISDRNLTMRFYRDILGMKVLRHEEFTEGCEATCNGPYNNNWSKTMIGYGSEDTHFVVELTYNYTVKSYVKGNDFIGITIKSSEVLQRAAKLKWPIEPNNVLVAPGGYKFFIVDEPQPTQEDPIIKVTLASSNLERTIKYWNGLLGLTIFKKGPDSVELAFSKNQAKLEMKEIDEPIDRGTAYGRIAFSCPYDQQPLIDQKIKDANEKILTPLITLDTPGKTTVRVIILADPDGHEICFVEDGLFRELSREDPQANQFLDTVMTQDLN